MEAGKYRAFQGRLNSRSSRVSLCWPPMSVCGKNVYALRACKRSNRDFLRLYTGNTYTFSLIQSSSIRRRLLRCLLGFLAKNPAGAIILKMPFFISEIRVLHDNQTLTTAWLDEMVQRQTTVRKVEGWSPRPSQHSGSFIN